MPSRRRSRVRPSRAFKIIVAVLTALLSTATGAAPALAGTPEASFDHSPGFPYEGEKLTLTSTSAPADKIVAWEWDLDGDGKFDDATGAVITHGFADAGDHQVGLRVRDTDLDEDEVVNKIVVIAPPRAAFTSAPGSPRTGETVTLTAAAQDTLRRWDWDLDGDGAHDDASGSTVTTSFPTAGAHTVGLKVTDLRDNTDATTRDITVTAPPPPPPLPAAPFAISDQTPAAGRPVVFDATPVDKGHGGVKAHKWDLDGDGIFERNTNKAPAVEVTFGKAGPITPGLLIAFADGSTARHTASMVVEPGAAPSAVRPLLPRHVPVRAGRRSRLRDVRRGGARPRGGRLLHPPRRRLLHGRARAGQRARPLPHHGRARRDRRRQRGPCAPAAGWSRSSTPSSRSRT